MKQRSLFDDDVSEAPSLSAALVVTGPAAQKLNKKQALREIEWVNLSHFKARATYT